MQVDYPRDENVAVDNDPTTDHSTDLVPRRFGSMIRYVREDQRGLAAAHNRGLEVAETHVVAFVDGDVVDRRLIAIAKGFTAAANVGCVAGLILPTQLETQAQLLTRWPERHGRRLPGWGRAGRVTNDDKIVIRQLHDSLKEGNVP